MRATYADEADIPEANREEYQKTDAGGWALKLEGDHPAVTSVVADANAKVREADRQRGEFRDNNLELLQGLGVESFEEAKTKLKALTSIDPKKYEEDQAKLADLEKRGVSRSDDIAAIVAKQVEAATAPYKVEVENMKTKEANAAASLAKKEVETALTAAAVRVGVQESAVEDFVARGARSGFTYEGGRVIMKDGEEVVFSQRKPADPLGVDEWAESLQESAPHIFKPSEGGGSRGGTRQGGVKHVNAFDPLEFGKNAEAIAAGDAKVTH